MGNSRNKIFRDPVHGYISVPEDICNNFVDTEIFQRLRCIEQTSIRPLYPAARHDRFIHSLGVFYLATIAFDFLSKNVIKDIFDSSNFHKYKKTFIIAALMHDCGHAPFSHTCEHFYNDNKMAEKFLFKYIDDEFRKDYEIGLEPAAHEIFSAALFLKHFSATIKEHYPDADPSLVARMITGCIHQEPKNDVEEIENALIRLINDDAIDLDKIDYILRDTWISGVDNISIDVRRLLSSITISRFDGHLFPVYNKSALSIIQNVIDAKNYLYRWVYSHHLVIYHELLFNEIISDLFDEYEKKNVDIKSILFSEDVFEKPVDAGKVQIYLPSDGDLYFLLKNSYASNKKIKEIFQRRYQLLPLWKTEAEFNLIFSKKNENERSKIESNTKKILQPLLGKHSEIIVKHVNPKITTISEKKILIKINNTVVPFNDLSLIKDYEHMITTYFLVYIPISKREDIKKCIDKLQNYYT